MSRVVACVVCLLVLSASIAAGADEREPRRSDADGARIVELYPNPVVDEDRGEFVVVTLPNASDGWSLADGESTVRIPDGTSGRVALSPDPDSAAESTDHRVVEVSDRLALANDGERVRLLRDGDAVDAVSYDDAPEGERWIRDGEPRWRPLGYEPRSAVDAGPATARAFVLPDDPAVPTAALRRADRRILLAAYTFTSRDVADELVAAVERGVSVRVLVDDAPVGGIAAREATVLDRLTASGVEVEVIGGERARYAFHHPKYAVVDDRALVMTENWKPSGTGGRGSRGWGVEVESSDTAAELAGVFDADAGWRDSTPWREFRRGQTFVESEPADGRYASRVETERVEVDRVRVVTAPGNAEEAIVDELDGASERIDVVQPTVDDRTHPFLRASVRAAERGVRVRILLSGAWYVEEDNRALVDSVNGYAERRSLPLEAQIAEPRGRYEKIHAKGIVVDDRVVLGSVNWNNASVRENREVALVLESEAAAAYYRGVFEADWDTGKPPIPVGLVAAVVAVVLGALAYARRRIGFAAETRGGEKG
ncbi:phospholipase D-like domain-containing protein [Halegenticoccus tardaugens]|uniref:phospholipase D-like domain-containing protein n=1 Tax=Halegenticoccus tardaugens TaxID=2071624 RepID=UPI001E4171D6|nr:phospholipase D-like domain-containing protein [Halegenticoccus tardaugens]